METEMMLKQQTKRKDRNRIILQERDYNILYDLNEMGMADVPIIAVKHFLKKDEVLTDSRLRTAYERCFELSQLGVIAMHRLQKGRGCYRTTSLGVSLLANHDHDIAMLRPMTNIPLGTMDHDHRIHWARIALERRGDVRAWRSERRLLSEERDYQKKNRPSYNFKPYIPDGVYLSQAGYKTIFELELAAKTTNQMKIRVDTVMNLLIYFKERYHRVHIICCSESVRDRYMELSKVFGFKVELLSDLLKEVNLHDTFERFGKTR